jgi:hypothetical protein
MANFSVNAHQGKQLPSNWKAQAPATARAAEADYLQRIENAWRSSSGGSREGITARDARLTNDSASRVDSGSQSTVRMDGKMLLVGRQDDWEIWRDSTTGGTVWRRK